MYNFDTLVTQSIRIQAYVNLP